VFPERQANLQTRLAKKRQSPRSASKAQRQPGFRGKDVSKSALASKSARAKLADVSRLKPFALRANYCRIGDAENSITQN
jgi:hypothetical protein